MVKNTEHPSATPAELRALAHPLSWRVLRLCLDEAWTNQQLAERLGVSPATLLRRLRALTAAGFLMAEPPRQSPLGAWERPYRATRRTWQLDLGSRGDHLNAQVELAILDAHRAEIQENAPDAPQHTRRLLLRLDADDRAELNDRIDALLEEFAGREKPQGKPVSVLWNAIERHEPAEAD